MEKFKIPLFFGALGGLILFVLFLIGNFTDSEPLSEGSLPGMLAQIFVIYYGIKKVRQVQFNKFIGYWRAFLTGIVITVKYAFFFSFLIFMFGKLIDDSFIIGIKEKKLEAIELQREHPIISSAEYMNALDIEEINTKALTLKRVCIEEVLYKFFLGLIVSLIVAGILKKTPSPFEEPAHAEQN